MSDPVGAVLAGRDPHCHPSHIAKIFLLPLKLKRASIFLGRIADLTHDGAYLV